LLRCYHQQSSNTIWQSLLDRTSISTFNAFNDSFSTDSICSLLHQLLIGFTCLHIDLLNDLGEVIAQREDQRAFQAGNEHSENLWTCPSYKSWDLGEPWKCSEIKIGPSIWILHNGNISNILYSGAVKIHLAPVHTWFHLQCALHLHRRFLINSGRYRYNYIYGWICLGTIH